MRELLVQELPNGCLKHQSHRHVFHIDYLGRAQEGSWTDRPTGAFVVIDLNLIDRIMRSLSFHIEDLIRLMKLATNH
jgi:hypothetical protein